MLSPSASVRVSQLCLGSMNFGKAWEGFMGSCDQEATNGILDFFYENGGNFIDTVGSRFMPHPYVEANHVDYGRPTTTKMRNLNNGLVSGWRRREFEIKWSLQPNTQPHSVWVKVERLVRFWPTLLVMVRKVCVFLSMLV